MRSISHGYRNVQTRFFGYPRSTEYDVAMYNESEKTNEGFANLLQGARCQDAQHHSMGSGADFREFTVVDLKIVFGC